MKVSYIVKRYIAILGRLSNQKKANFQQLMDAIERMGGEDMIISQRTFQRMINDIEDLFQVSIKCDRAGFYYILEDASDMQHSKITQSLHFFNYQKHLENFENHIAYAKYNPQERNSAKRELAPYGLKEFKGRWYLVGKDLAKNELRIFGLDRIDNLEASSRRALIPKDFSIHKYFKHSIGSSVDSEDISEFVELTFSPKLAGYIKNFPIHPSQLILSDTNEGVLIKLRTYINLELVNELMLYSDDVKIIKPTRLKKMMIKRHEEFLKNNPQ